MNFLTQSESRSILKRSELTWKKPSQSIFQRLIPNIKVLFSVRHLKHRDEMKLDSLMEKWKNVTASAAEKTKARAEILNDIYRERKGTTYDLVS